MIHPSRKEIVTLNGNSLYTEYTQRDKKLPTIVFLHDSLGCVALWRDFPSKIAEATQYNLLVYDRFGYGKSDPMPDYKRLENYLETEADVLNNLLSYFEIEDAILFGHSDGGSIALITAAKYPEKVKAVVCEAGHIFVEKITLEGIFKAMESYQNTNLSEKLAKYHGDKVDTIFKAWTLTWTNENFLNWNIEYLLPQIVCPLLFIQGDADEYGSLEQVEKTLEQISGKAEKFILPNVGHTPHKESPSLVLETTIHYLQEKIKK